MTARITTGDLAATLLAAQNVGTQLGINTSTWHIGTRGGTYLYLLRTEYVLQRDDTTRPEVERVADLGRTKREAYDKLHALMEGMRLVQQHSTTLPGALSR